MAIPEQLKFPELDDSNWTEVEPPPDQPTDAHPDKFDGGATG